MMKSISRRYSLLSFILKKIMLVTIILEIFVTKIGDKSLSGGIIEIVDVCFMHDWNEIFRTSPLKILSVIPFHNDLVSVPPFPKVLVDTVWI